MECSYTKCLCLVNSSPKNKTLPLFTHPCLVSNPCFFPTFFKVIFVLNAVLEHHGGVYINNDSCNSADSILCFISSKMLQDISVLPLPMCTCTCHTHKCMHAHRLAFWLVFRWHFLALSQLDWSQMGCRTARGTFFSSGAFSYTVHNCMI